MVKSIVEGESKSRSAVKRALNKLAFGEMIEAVQHCDRLLKLAQLDAFKQPVGESAGVQDRVIDALRKLLDVARQGAQRGPGGGEEAAGQRAARRRAASSRKPATSSMSFSGSRRN